MDEQYTQPERIDDDPDTTVICDACRRRLRINFESRLAGEWPHCHGAAMRVQSTSVDPYQAVAAGLERGGRP